MSQQDKACGQGQAMGQPSPCCPGDLIAAGRAGGTPLCNWHLLMAHAMSTCDGKH